MWPKLDEVGRDEVLDGFMRWAWLLHDVQIKLLQRGPGVTVAELRSHQPGRGRARVVMEVLCDWSDCARVRLELTPTDQYGADLPRLTAFYASLGFGGDLDEPWLGIEQPGLMARYPALEPSPMIVGRARVPGTSYGTVNRRNR